MCDALRCHIKLVSFFKYTEALYHYTASQPSAMSLPRSPGPQDSGRAYRVSYDDRYDRSDARDNRRSSPVRGHDSRDGTQLGYFDHALTSC